MIVSVYDLSKFSQYKVKTLKMIQFYSPLSRFDVFIFTVREIFKTKTINGNIVNILYLFYHLQSSFFGIFGNHVCSMTIKNNALSDINEMMKTKVVSCLGDT